MAREEPHERGTYFAWVRVQLEPGDWEGGPDSCLHAP
jgi:hypothetical protein